MIIILIVLIVSILAQHYCTNERYKPLILKTFAKDVDSSATNEEIKINVQQKLLKVLAIGLLVFFVGIGAGAGAAKVKRIEEGNLKYYYTLNLISGEEHDIYLIGWNTSYYFYARKGDNKIYISPVTSVKTLAIKDDRDVK